MEKKDIESKEEKKRRKREKKEKKKRKRDSVEPSASSVSCQANQNTEQKVKRLDDEETNGNSNDPPEISGPRTPFQRKQASILLSLVPSAMTNTAKAMHACMQSMLLKYSDGLGGVLLSFDNIKVDKSKNGGSFGRVLNEMPHIHFYVICDVFVFNPSIGTTLTGVVNETFPSHVGLLVHELFNAMISAEYLRESGFVFDIDLNEWSKEDTMTPISSGDSIQFTVEMLHECNGLISLECKDPVIS